MAISDYINKRRESNKATPWADLIDTRRESGKNTPFADWLGYNPPSTLTEKEGCDNREGYHWDQNSLGTGGTCVRDTPYTPETGGGGEE